MKIIVGKKKSKNHIGKDGCQRYLSADMALESVEDALNCSTSLSNGDLVEDAQMLRLAVDYWWETSLKHCPNKLFGTLALL